MVSLSLLLFAPLSLLLKYGIEASPLWVFAAATVAIAVLADWVRRATEHLAARAGPAIGGLLNVSFGSLAELILALFVLMGGNATVVKAQISGSIIGTSLLGLGLAILAGAWGRDKQTFRRERAGMLSSLLILVVIALLLPAVFHYTGHAVVRTRDLPAADEELSLSVSVVLLLIYGANLVYTLATRRDAFESEEAPQEGIWPLALSLAVLVGSTAAIAVEAELVSGTLEAAGERLHLSALFVGVVVLALVGTAADLFAAASFARQDKMGLVLSICIGSAIQMALVIAPLLVIVSWLIGRPMTLVFSDPLELFSVAGAVFAVNAIAVDGETTWFERLMLVGVYALLALAFFFVGAT